MRRIQPGLLLCLASSLAIAQTSPPGTTPEAAASGSAPAAPAASTVAAPPSGAGAATATGGNGLRWRIPPIGWGGSVAYDFREDRAQDQGRTAQHLVSLNLLAATYLYQPWLATLGLELGLVNGHTNSSQLGARTEDNFATGTVRLGVFPRSRFPFELRYEASDSRTDASLGAGASYTSRTLGLTQRYRPVDGLYQVSGGYERRVQEGETFGSTTQQVLRGELTARWKVQNLSLTLSHNDSERQQTDEHSTLSTLALRHNFSGSNAVTIDSGVNWARADDQLQTGSRQVTLVDASTVAIWRPTGEPYALNGSLRTLNLQDDSGGQSESIVLGAGGSYDLSKNLRLGANMNLTKLNGQTRTAWTGGLNATYQGPSIQLGEWGYDWFTSAAYFGSRNGGENSRNLNTQLGHSTHRTVRNDSGHSLAVTFSQSITAAHTSGGLRAELAGSGDTAVLSGWRRGLLHAASFTWTNSGDSGSASARLSLSDSRQLDGDRARFQLVNFQLSGSHEFSRYSGWSGNLTLQRAFQSDNAAEVNVQDPLGFNRQINHSVSGEVNWRHSRAFGVPRLRFTSSLRASGDNQVTALALPSDRESLSWENRLDYRVGRLDTSIRYRMAEEDGRWRRALALRVQRNFGE